MTLKSLLKTLLLLPVFMAQPVLAQWSLDNDASTLSFVTVKADHVAEVHTFEMLSGSVARSGAVTVSIELASVNTNIAIRNERMQAMLFETSLFPNANISAQIDIAALGSMAAGASHTLQVPFQLDIHGVSTDYTADVLVTRLQSGLLVSSVKPVIVTAEAHNLVTGVEALREIAGLPVISRAVPVSFTLVFEQ
jgi:polyisoprenoid-binding protein YceI